MNKKSGGWGCVIVASEAADGSWKKEFQEVCTDLKSVGVELLTKVVWRHGFHIITHGLPFNLIKVMECKGPQTSSS